MARGKRQSPPLTAAPPAVRPSRPQSIAIALPPPSLRKLVQGSVAALAVAIVVLVIAVLPAEYGIDPTGLGQRLGIRGLSAKPSGPVASDASLTIDAPSPRDGGDVWRREATFRSDEMSLTLAPNQGAEIKARMQRGERYVFSWDVEGGKVDFDMHGEAVGAPPDAFTSYWKGGEQQSGHGAFVAPADGTHGWYWKNRGSTPVTVRVKTSGFYEKLYRP